MADAKITALAALLGADVADGDLLPVVDVSVADALKNKKITAAEARIALVTAARIAAALGYTPATAAQGATADAALPAAGLSAALAALSPVRFGGYIGAPAGSDADGRIGFNADGTAYAYAVDAAFTAAFAVHMLDLPNVVNLCAWDNTRKDAYIYPAANKHLIMGSEAYITSFSRNPGGCFIFDDGTIEDDGINFLQVLGSAKFTGPILTAQHAAPADADLATGDMAIWFDQSNGTAKCMFKAKQADGTVKTGSVNITT